MSYSRVRLALVASVMMQRATAEPDMPASYRWSRTPVRRRRRAPGQRAPAPESRPAWCRRNRRPIPDRCGSGTARRGRLPPDSATIPLVRRSCHTMAGWIGLPLPPIPHDGGLALIGDADRRHLGRAAARGRHFLARHGDLAGQDLLGIVLHPARAREHLAELLLCYRCDRSGSVEQERPRSGGALIEGHHVSAHGGANLNPRAPSRNPMPGPPAAPDSSRQPSLPPRIGTAAYRSGAPSRYAPEWSGRQPLGRWAASWPSPLSRRPSASASHAPRRADAPAPVAARRALQTPPPCCRTPRPADAPVPRCRPPRPANAPAPVAARRAPQTPPPP